MARTDLPPFPFGPDQPLEWPQYTPPVGQPGPLGDLGVDFGRVLHGEQEFELHGQLRPGETYLCRTRIVDIYEKTGRSGPMAFVVRETAVTDRTGEIVVTMRHVTVVRL